jgi:Zn-finger nucleic acid-binding protein
MDVVSNRRPCRVEQVGRARNGRPRWWCAVHGGNATGPGGARQETCDSTSLDISLSNCLHLDPSEYPGGIAVWAALRPVFDTSGRPQDAGIHVHARQEVGISKQIDGTYPAVAVRCRPDLFGNQSQLLTRDAAINYHFSRLLGHRVKHLSCPRCQAVHLDAGWFAIRPHRQHLCQGCGRLFRDQDPAVSNPIAFVREALGDLNADRRPVRASGMLDIRQSDYPGGIQIWASNPAIIWTAPKPEEEGIHVHLFSDHFGRPLVDETFDRVRIDGIELDDAMVHCLMAQQALPYLTDRVENLTCPCCGGAHFDRGELAFGPHWEHTCEHCGAAFRARGPRRLSVGNPLVSTLEILYRTSPQSAPPEHRQ